MEIDFPMDTSLRDWYRCKSCNTDLRSGRHIKPCQLTGPEAQLEMDRVRSVISTYNKIKKPVVIKGGRRGDQPKT